MDTSKILAFRHPSQVELLLESLLKSLNRLPEHSHKVTERSDLPSVLQRIAIQAKKQKIRWGAWAKDNVIWFFTVEMTTAPLGLSRRPALKISRYNQKGKLTECGVWYNVPPRGWQRCALL
jgi:hypothetical protein